MGASPPLAEEGRLVPGIQPWAGEGAWAPQDRRPRFGREHVVGLLGSLCPPPALSWGPTLPPRTQVSKVPARVGPAPGPSGPSPFGLAGSTSAPPLGPWGPPVDTCPFIWPDNLAVVLAAAGSSPSRCTAPGQGLRAGWSGVSQAPAHLPRLCYPCRWGLLRRYFKCGVTNLLWGLCLVGPLGAKGCGLSCDGLESGFYFCSLFKTRWQ